MESPSVCHFQTHLIPNVLTNSKSRALKRQENFNNMTKVLEILAQRQFRRLEAKFGWAFEVVCIIRQYKLENEMPLYYDVLIDAVINAKDDDDSSTASGSSDAITIDDGMQSDDDN
jgi:hypothetical protein